MMSAWVPIVQWSELKNFSSYHQENFPNFTLIIFLVPLLRVEGVIAVSNIDVFFLGHPDIFTKDQSIPDIFDDFFQKILRVFEWVLTVCEF